MAYENNQKPKEGMTSYWIICIKYHYICFKDCEISFISLQFVKNKKDTVHGHLNALFNLTIRQ